MGVEVEQQAKEHEDMMDVGSSPDRPPVAQHENVPLSPPPTEISALPGDAASKRQRRPNVRLNEIGSESSLANVVEYLLKRKGGRGHGIVGAKRGRKAHTDKHSSPATTTNGPGKLSKTPKLLPKFKSDDDHEDDDVLHHAGDIKPHTLKPFDEQKLTPKGQKRKVVLGGKSRFPDHSIGTAIAKRAKHPKAVFSHPPEGNGNNWMHKAMTGVAEGFLEAADGGVYGCSDTDKRPRSPSTHVLPVNSSFESDSPKGFQKAQATTKRKKKVGTGTKAPTTTGHPHKGEAVEEKEEPASSDVQELRMQGPVWERGIPPLDDKVREWIQGIGLEKYASVFQHHEVGDDVVPLLTMDDLKEMGINAVGARRKFFSEITKRRQGLMLAEERLADEK